MIETPPMPESSDPKFRRSDGGVDWVAFRAAASEWAAVAVAQEQEHEQQEGEEEEEEG
jgi:hypothetical protein